MYYFLNTKYQKTEIYKKKNFLCLYFQLISNQSFFIKSLSTKDIIKFLMIIIYFESIEIINLYAFDEIKNFIKKNK